MNTVLRSLLLSFLCLASFEVRADSIQLTTYYPAPFGAYSRLLLNPQADAGMPACTAAISGTVYMSSTTNEVKLCVNPNWVSLNPWTANATTQTVHLTASIADAAYKVGIGVIPTANSMKLHIDQDGGILAEGAFGDGAAVGAPGGGVRLLWYPALAAFRAGSVSGAQWDDGNIGNYSVAFGQNNIASGGGSAVVGGAQNTASGAFSFVGGGGGFIGIENEATASQSAVIGGFENSADSDNSIVLGGTFNHAQAGGASTAVIGGTANNITAGSYGGILGGSSNTSSSDAAVVAGGTINTASGSSSFIGGGDSNTASSQGTFIGGGANNTASGQYSVIIGGHNNTATGQGAAVLGGSPWVANSAAGNASATVGGESIHADGPYSVVLGGYVNTINGGQYNVIAGGQTQSITGGQSFIGGGMSNNIGGNDSTIIGSTGSSILAGAFGNVIAGSSSSNINAGNNNFIGGSSVGNINGINSVIISGTGNQIDSANSIAGGSNMNLDAVATNTFAFGNGDSSAITTPNAFLMFPTGTPGNVGINMAAPTAELEVAGTVKATNISADTMTVNSTSIILNDGVNSGPLQVDCTTAGDGNCYAVAVYAP